MFGIGTFELILFLVLFYAFFASYVWIFKRIR